MRARGYNRTSGEKQRENTSIPRQKAEIEKFIADKDGWNFSGHYVDECKSGAKVEGRDDFKRMMKDAANGEFDILVIHDIDRFGRNGREIVDNAYLLKENFDVHVVDTKGKFDTRKSRHTLLNFIHAGLADDERLRIMERTIGGRIEKAKNGLPWSPKLPKGRGFKETGKNKGEWFITEEGKQLRELLIRYTNGEPVKPLAREYGITSTQTITRNVRESQLSGTYYAKFHSPEIGINNLKIPVSGVPEVITQELEKRVRGRMALNKKWNKRHKRKYVLSSFANCDHCNKSLKGQTKTDGSNFYYRHNNYLSDEKKTCPYHGINGDLLESHVLDYLYSFFLDKPAYNKAVEAALPSADDRKALEKDIQQVISQISKAKRKISNLVNAIADGVDASLLIDKQNEFKAEIQALENRRDELQQTLDAMPNPEIIKQDAKLLRWKLMSKHWGRDWRKIPYDDIRKFLHFLFSDNPRKNGYGIFVGKQNGRWHITFRGCAEFNHDVIDGEPEFSSRLTQKEIDLLTVKIEAKQKDRKRVDKAANKYEKAKKDVEGLKALIAELKEEKECSPELKPNKVNL